MLTAEFSALILFQLVLTALATVTSEAPLALNTPKVVAERPLSLGDLGAPLRCHRARRQIFAQAPPISLRERSLGYPERPPRSRAGQHADRLFAAAHLGAAAGGIHVERLALLIDFDGGEAQSLQPAGVPIRLGSRGRRRRFATPVATPGSRAAVWSRYCR